MKSPLRLALLLLALALAGAACSRSNAAETTTTFAPVESTTTTTPTTTSSTTTTTTQPGVAVAETVNGLPGESPELEDRRAVAVKIDNHPEARPQAGLEVADAVYEVLVEGGITRFIAIFHQSDAEYLGPNRSGRPTDIGIVKPLDAPFQISGAQPWVLALFRDNDIRIVGDNGVTTYRVNDRPRPNNLFTSTIAIREYADDREWPDEAPPPLFVFGAEPTELEGEATAITTAFSDVTPSIWRWDGEQYLKFIGVEPHVWVNEDRTVEEQLAFATLVVIRAPVYTASPASGSGTPVPATNTVGSGEALVFHSGGVLTATWERGSDEEPIRLFTAEDDEVVLPPGRIWISVVPTTGRVIWE